MKEIYNQCMEFKFLFCLLFVSYVPITSVCLFSVLCFCIGQFMPVFLVCFLYAFCSMF